WQRFHHSYHRDRGARPIHEVIERPARNELGSSRVDDFDGLLFRGHPAIPTPRARPRPTNAARGPNRSAELWRGSGGGVPPNPVPAISSLSPAQVAAGSQVQ